MTTVNVTAELARRWGIMTGNGSHPPDLRLDPYAANPALWPPEPVNFYGAPETGRMYDQRAADAMGFDNRPRCARCAKLIPGYAAMPTRQAWTVLYCSLERAHD